jgi:hypothetical protein
MDGLFHVGRAYSMTSSARTTGDGGIAMPTAFAVSRLRGVT